MHVVDCLLRDLIYLVWLVSTSGRSMTRSSPAMILRSRWARPNSAAARSGLTSTKIVEEKPKNAPSRSGWGGVSSRTISLEAERTPGRLAMLSGLFAVESRWSVASTTINRLLSWLALTLTLLLAWSTAVAHERKGFVVLPNSAPHFVGPAGGEGDIAEIL